MAREWVLHPVPRPRGGPGSGPVPCQHLWVRTSRQLQVTRSAGLLLAAVLLAGCGSQSGPDTEDASAAGSAPASSAAPEETTASSSSAAPEDGGETTPFPGDTAPDTAEPVDAEGLTVTAVRAGRHEGFDRVVFELSGSGTPGWTVEYVDAPSDQVEGMPIAVPGAAFLQVTLQSTTYPYESGAEEVPRGPVAVSGTEVVAGVVYDATFEGMSVGWIGTAAETPFRVYALTGPSRVVVEVADTP